MIHLYLSASNGNDDNDGFTPQTAWQTRQQYELYLIDNPTIECQLHIVDGFDSLQYNTLILDRETLSS